MSCTFYFTGMFTLIWVLSSCLNLYVSLMSRILAGRVFQRVIVLGRKLLLAVAVLHLMVSKQRWSVLLVSLSLETCLTLSAKYFGVLSCTTLWSRVSEKYIDICRTLNQSHWFRSIFVGVMNGSFVMLLAALFCCTCRALIKYSLHELYTWII